ncbi:hypothetical protein [Sphingomonas sp.]|jgi:hypothetical protein|uniref:gp53-like domain-containing protein n=1 Tax=Sphingomonas sp. TaxID=28214 RepID=UPI003568A38A
MTALKCTLTDAGRAAMVDPVTGGTRAVRIAAVGVTAATVLVAPTLTALPGEIKRIAAVSGTAIDATTVHLTMRDSSTDAYTCRAIGVYLADGTLFAVYGQASAILEKISASVFYIALDLKVLAGQADLIQFGDANFVNPPASESVKGVAYLATIAEALAGAVADKLITPATMKAVLDNYVAASRLGVAGGIATLGPDGKLLLSQRPPVDLIDVFAVANQAQMLALAATPGDFAVRSDNGRVYVLQQTPATVLANWLEISTPAPVSSVNNKVGTVVLGPDDVGAVPIGRTISVAGGLLQGGGPLTGDRTISLPAATQEQCAAGIRGDLVVTPSGLGPLLVLINDKVSGGRTIGTSGLVRGGGGLANDLTLTVDPASPSDLFSGVRNDLAATPYGLANLPQSLTPNGYTSLPGGFMIQWVQLRQIFTTEASVYVTFPIAFRNIALPIVAMGHTDTASTLRDLWPQRVGVPDLYGCVIQLQSGADRDRRLDGFDLIVMGK